LRENLKEWIDIDLAAFELANSLGVIEQQSFLEAKWVLWSDNNIGKALFEILGKLVEAGVWEKRDELDFQYRRTYASESTIGRRPVGVGKRLVSRQHLTLARRQAGSLSYPCLRKSYIGGIKPLN
jgi:hypothetical protein